MVSNTLVNYRGTIYLPDKPHRKRLSPSATPRPVSSSSRCEYGYYRPVILKQHCPKPLVPPWPEPLSWPSTAKEAAITMNHPKHSAFNWTENWSSLWTSCRVQKESLSAGPGGCRALASLSHVFQYTNEKKIHLSEEERLLRGKGWGSWGAMPQRT